MRHNKLRKLQMAVLITFLCAGAYAADSGKKDKKSPSTQAQESAIEKQIYSDAVDAYNAKDYEKAIKLFLPLAEQGHVGAQEGLGMSYHSGSHVEEAQRWYELAYKGGARGNTANNLGLIYRDGSGGVGKDIKKAEQLFVEAGGNHKYALHNLAELYLRESDFFNEKNLRKGLQFARKAAELGLDDENLVSTIECALNTNARVKNTWDNAQSLQAFDLNGKVMSVNYGGIVESGVLLFGKSGQLINATTITPGIEYNYAYSYDKSCNPVSEVRTSTNAKGEKKILRVIDSIYLNGRLDYQKTFDGSRRFTYQELSDGSVFTTIETASKFNASTSYRHVDRNGKLIWSSENEWPPYGIAHKFFNGLVPGGSSVYPPRINNSFNGRVSYDKGYYYVYAPNGKLEKILDRAGHDGTIRGALAFEYDGNGFLKRENGRDEITVGNDYNYKNYQKDSNGNWVRRTQSFLYKGEVVPTDHSREIKYW